MIVGMKDGTILYTITGVSVALSLAPANGSLGTMDFYIENKVDSYDVIMDNVNQGYTNWQDSVRDVEIFNPWEKNGPYQKQQIGPLKLR